MPQSPPGPLDRPPETPFIKDPPLVPDDRPGTGFAPVDKALHNLDLAIDDVARHWIFGWQRLIVFLIIVIFVAFMLGMVMK